MTKSYSTQIASICLLALSTHSVASSYPHLYQISDTGFQHSQPLHQKLKQRQGELFFKETGLFLGASDAVYQDRIESEENTEVDAYAGIKKDLGLIGYHVGVKTYNRSVEKDIEFQEYFVGGNIKQLSFSYAANDDGEYTQINLSHAISTVTVGFHIGKTKSLLGDEYADWSLHASKAFKDMKFNAIMSNSENPIIRGTEFNIGLERSFKWF